MSDLENTETMGASEDVDEEQTVADDGHGDDEETGRAEAPKPKPPASKPDPKDEDPYSPPSADEWRRTQAALKKANEDGKRHRLRNKELEDAARAGETEHEKALREAREEGEKRYRAPLVKVAARAALSEAGLSGSTDRVMRLLDLEALSVDDDGDVVGVDGEVARLKQEYPEFFQAAKSKPKPRPTAADRQPAEEKPRSSAERHAMKVLGRAG